MSNSMQENFSSDLPGSETAPPALQVPQVAPGLARTMSDGTELIENLPFVTEPVIGTRAR